MIETLYWGAAHASSSLSTDERVGIGDFICQLPALHYYSNLLNKKILFDSAKYSDVLWCYPNVEIKMHKKEYTIPFNNSHLNGTSHMSAQFLPKCPKSEANYLNIEEHNGNPFIYPRIAVSNLEKEFIKQKYAKWVDFNKPIVCCIKNTSGPTRDWCERGWSELSKLLYKNNIQIVNLGQSKFLKLIPNPFTHTKHMIHIGDNISIREMAVMCSIAFCVISPNTGLFHLATAAQNKKVIVLHEDDKTAHKWMYPNNIKINKDREMGKVLSDVIKRLS